MIITRDDTTGILQLKSYLHKQFKIKDLGLLTYFLGIEVTHGDDGYSLFQAKYASNLLSQAQLIDTKVASTPLKYNTKVTAVDGTLLEDPISIVCLWKVLSILLLPNPTLHMLSTLLVNLWQLLEPLTVQLFHGIGLY